MHDGGMELSLRALSSSRLVGSFISWLGWYPWRAADGVKFVSTLAALRRVL